MAQETAVLERDAVHEDRPAADDSIPGLLLPPSVQEVLDGILQVVRRESKDVRRQVKVYQTAAAAEIETHLVVSVETDLPAAEAFALWDRIGDAVQNWTMTLPKPQENVALGIAVEVLWSVDHAAP